MSTKAPEATYRGSLKHKRWSPGGGFGTICPDWTHQTAETGFAGDPHRHPWRRTEAQALFDDAIIASDGLRYAARRGIAFCARVSNDGTWHGYPIPWKDVDQAIQDALIAHGQVTEREIENQKSRQKRALRRNPKDIYWALGSDDE